MATIMGVVGRRATVLCMQGRKPPVLRTLFLSCVPLCDVYGDSCNS